MSCPPAELFIKAPDYPENGLCVIPKSLYSYNQIYNS